MAEFLFARRFLQDLAEWEATASTRDREALEKALASIALNPAQPGRVPSFYDPLRPSYLHRAGSVLIHFRVRPDGAVELLNLFFRKS